MAQIGCKCGAQVSDTVVPNPAKAHFVRDVDLEAVQARVAQLSAGYLEAILANAAPEWLKAQGFLEDYIALNLTHAEIFDDFGTLAANDAWFEILECDACGRLLVETEPNRFSYYSADEGDPLRPFAMRRVTPLPPALPPAI